MADLAETLELVGRKWALLIVEDLLERPRRFTEIERSLVDASFPKYPTLPVLRCAGYERREEEAER